VFYTAKLLKSVLPEVKVVIGGIHATSLPQQTLEECEEIDVVVIGEGEFSFLELLRHYRDQALDIKDILGIAYRENGQIKITSQRPIISNLDRLPMPAYHLFPMEKYIFGANGVMRYPTYGLVIARGCPYRCTFCDANTVHGKKLRFRSVEKVLEEIAFLQSRFCARGFVFQDSTFTANKKWLHSFCDALIERKMDIVWACGARVDTLDNDILIKMKAAGCWSLTLGIESGNQKSLDLIRKGVTIEQNQEAVIKALELNYFVGAMYILGLPGENEQDVKNTIAFAKELATHYALFFLPIPFPNTELWKQCEEDGGLRNDIEWADFRSTEFSNPVYINPLIGREKFIKLTIKAYRTYYTHPKVLFRNLISIRSLDHIRRNIYALRALLGI